MGRSSLHIQRKTNQKIQTTRNTMSVSFKVTLSKGEEQETRRFQVDKEVAGSLVYLKQKIAAIFPELRRSEPILCWVDEDGDEVVVTSDEELQVALTALTGPLYKLCSLQESCPKVPPCKTGQPYSGRSKHPGACQSLWWQALGERLPRNKTRHAGNQEPSQES